MKTQILVASAALVASLLSVHDAYAARPMFTPSTPATIFKGVHRIIGANTSIDVSQLGAVADLAMSGKVTLSSDKGFVRVVLVTRAGRELLVLETNPLLAKGRHLELDEYCEETCALDGAAALRLEVEVTDAVLTLTTVSATPPSPGAAAKNTARTASQREAQQAEKLLSVRYSLKQRGLHWAAGDTPIARKTYAEKKLLWGDRVPNLSGFEYYIGGIFEVPASAATKGASAASVTASAYVSDFSWRNKHGQSWLTPPRDQGGCGSCWAFGATGATELLTNLYFNRHLDLDLSEQEALSCMSGGSCGGGAPEPVLDYIAQYGIFEETCFPYTATDQACLAKCASPTENVRIGGRVPFNNDSEDTLKSLILHSAVSMGIFDWWHVLTLAGYRTLKVGDAFFVRDGSGNTQWITVRASDTDLIGKTVWEFKNSWGSAWGDNGYVYVLTELGNIYLTDQLLPPVIRAGHTDAEIRCVDSDGDGYYTWGIGARPSQCPAGIPVQADGDDGNRCRGPMDSYGNITELCPIVDAQFTATNLSPCLGTSTTFTDLSTGTVTGWSWSFGAGATPATATGKGPWTVTYATTGAKTVTLSVTGPSGAQDSESKNAYITVPSQCNPYGLEVYAKDEGYYETNLTKPRIYIANMGSSPIDNFKVIFKFTTNGKTPKLEDWYTPYESVSLTKVAGNTYKVVYSYSGYTLNPGAVVPDTSGNVIGLHYTDWSAWNVTTSFRPGPSFAITTDLGVYDKNGNLVYGAAQ